MRSHIVLGAIGLVSGFSVTVVSAQNVALGKPVSLAGGAASGADLSTLTDGIFRPRGTLWTDGTIYWSGLDTALEVDLGGTFLITGATVQVDDNDAYTLLYRDLATGDWLTMWDVPNYDAFGSGMQTRPNPDNDSEVFMFASPVTTDRVRLVAASGDNSYSASELVLIPAPGAAGLLVAGMFGVTRRKR